MCSGGREEGRSAHLWIVVLWMDGAKGGGRMARCYDNFAM